MESVALKIGGGQVIYMGFAGGVWWTYHTDTITEQDWAAFCARVSIVQSADRLASIVVYHRCGPPSSGQIALFEQALAKCPTVPMKNFGTAIVSADRHTREIMTHPTFPAPFPVRGFRSVLGGLTWIAGLSDHVCFASAIASIRDNVPLSCQCHSIKVE